MEICIVIYPMQLGLHVLNKNGGVMLLNVKSYNIKKIMVIGISIFMFGCVSAPGGVIKGEKLDDKSSEYLTYKRSIVEHISFDIKNGEIVNVMSMDGSLKDIESTVSDMHEKNYRGSDTLSDCIKVESTHYSPCFDSFKDNETSIFQKRQYDGNVIKSALFVAISPLLIFNANRASDDAKKMMVDQTNSSIDEDVVNTIGRIVVSKKLEQIKQESLIAKNTEQLFKLKDFINKYPGYPDNVKNTNEFMRKQMVENNIKGVNDVLKSLPEYASRNDAIDWMRSLNTFEGYESAFNLSFKKEDAKSANNLAKTHDNRISLEHMALTLLGSNKTKVFSLSSGSLDQSSSTHSEGGGIFLKGAQSASNKFSINLQLYNNKDILALNDGDYKVKVKVTLSVPVHFQRASRWLGNADKYSNDEYVKELDIPFSPNSNRIETVDFTDVRTAYKDRGIMGGTTEVQMVDGATVKAEVINVSY